MLKGLSFTNYRYKYRAIQRGNSACIFGLLGKQKIDDLFLYKFSYENLFVSIIVDLPTFSL